MSHQLIRDYFRVKAEEVNHNEDAIFPTVTQRLIQDLGKTEDNHQLDKQDNHDDADLLVCQRLLGNFLI